MREQLTKVLTGKKKFNLIEIKTTAIFSIVVIFALVSVKYLTVLAHKNKQCFLLNYWPKSNQYLIKK